MRLTADREVCNGTGNCAAVAPQLFDLDAVEGKVMVGSGVIAEILVSRARQAVEECPTVALALIDP